MQGFDVSPVSARRLYTLVLSVDGGVVNNLYLKYARNEGIPLHCTGLSPVTIRDYL